MTNTVHKIFLLRLPSLRDPTYWGMVLVRNLLTIVVTVFLMLGLLVVVATSFMQLDISIKGTVNALEKCALDDNRTCASLQITEKQAREVRIGNPARVEMTDGSSYRHRIINGTVTAIQKIAENGNDATLCNISVELEPIERELGKSQPTIGLIVVGSQSGWKSLMSAIRGMF